MNIVSRPESFKSLEVLEALRLTQGEYHAKGKQT